MTDRAGQDEHGKAGQDSGPEIDSEGTWTGGDLLGTSDVISVGPPTPEQAQKWSMQSRVLWGVGAIFFGTLIAVIVGTGAHWITPEFASELARMILPTVLGSASTIIGVLFVAGRQQK